MNEPATYVQQNNRTHQWEQLDSRGWKEIGYEDTVDYLTVKYRLNGQGKLNVVWLRNKDVRWPP